MNEIEKEIQPPKVGDIAVYRVASVEDIGVFLDCGQPKDLFLPFREQTRELRVGDRAIVYVYMDNNDRMAGSMRIDKHIGKGPTTYKVGDEVELLVFAKTDLGFKAIVDGRHFGMLYADEVFERIRYAQRLTGYIKAIRGDGKLDLSLSRAGHKAASEDVAPRIMEMLEEEGGFLPINDKTSAERIHDLFGVSRKRFKVALGGLYKKRVISVDPDGIRLIEGAKSPRD